MASQSPRSGSCRRAVVLRGHFIVHGAGGGQAPQRHRKRRNGSQNPPAEEHLDRHPLSPLDADFERPSVTASLVQWSGTKRRRPAATPRSRGSIPPGGADSDAQSTSSATPNLCESHRAGPVRCAFSRAGGCGRGIAGAPAGRKAPVAGARCGQSTRGRDRAETASPASACRREAFPCRFCSAGSRRARCASCPGLAGERQALTGHRGLG